MRNVYTSTIFFTFLFCSYLFFTPVLFTQSLKIDSLENLLKKTIPDTQRIDILIDLLHTIKLQNPEKGLFFGGQALELTKTLRDTSRMISILSRMGSCYTYLGKLDTAETYFNQTLTLATSSKDSLSIGRLSNNLGNIYSDRGRLDTAIHFFEKALAFYTQPSHQVYEAITLNNLAIIYERKAEYSRAIELYFQALVGFEKASHKGGIGAVYANLGNVYQMVKAYDEAISYYQQSLKIKEEIGDTYGIAINYSNVGALYLEKEKLDSAKFYEEKALGLRQQIGDRIGESLSNINLGIIHFNLENYDTAINFLRMAYQMAKEIGNQPELVRAAMQLGRIYLHLNRLSTAEKYLLEAYELSKQIGEREAKLSIYKTLSSLYEKRKDTKGFKFYKQYIALNDSIRNDEKIREITQLELQYQFDKEKEIIEIERRQNEQLFQSQLQRQRLIRNASLGGFIAGLIILGILWRFYQQKQKSNRLLEAQKNTIQQSLEERETLLKEIHHRVKNNLQVVSSLLSLQSRTIEDPIALGAIKEGQNRVKAMALIHQNLYQEENLIGVELPEYIEKLTDSLLNSYKVNTKQIKIIRKIAPVSLDVDNLVPLALILNELISNSLKYAFVAQEKGEINVEIDQQAKGLKVVVRDNGIGLPTNFKLEEASSLGFKLVQSFVNRMRAKLEILSQGGTSIQFFLPNLG